MTSDRDPDKLDWRKSTFSGGGNDCVEVAITRDGVAVRDSKNPSGGALWLPADEWETIVASARAGELGRP